MYKFIHSSVTKSVKNGFRSLTPEEQSDFKQYKAWKKKRSNLCLRKKITDRKIYEYKAKISQGYKTWWGKIGKVIEHFSDSEVVCNETKEKLAGCQSELPGIESDLETCSS
ncbi:hypothetical protein ACRRVD_03020 [Candidatus Cardinium hertigii]|uniref:hypothetical protein n=1 Tax=Candidatus Cardinium hertigii TaxID=247481 RepID=UPI003D7E5B2C